MNMGKPHSKRDQHCILMSNKLNRAFQEQIDKKKCGFNLTNYNIHSSVSEFSICCFDSSNKATEIPLKVDLPPQEMPVGTSTPHSILLNSQVINRSDGLSKSTNSAADTNEDNCNKIEPFECELQVDTSSEKKQDWSFTLYDFDGKGKITKEELGNLFQALYDAVGSSIRLPLNGTKKLKLRLSIGHDSSHLNTTLKDQSPLLVKKKAKLKNNNRLTEWKEMSIQAAAKRSPQVEVVDSKDYTKLNNLDASPRAKPSAMSKMENQLTPAPSGIGHRLMLSCREQKKLTEMVHENMVRNQVRQQTGRKYHHTTHRHHHHHREARRHRSHRRQGDENRKPREKDRTYHLDLGGIEKPSCKSVGLPYSSSVPITTGTTVTTTSLTTFTRPSVINIVPSSSPPPPPPPPPPPTASGSTAYCNEIGMVADDDDDDGNDEVKHEVGGNGSRRKHDNTWREAVLDERIITRPDGLMASSVVETSGPQDLHHHQHHPHHSHQLHHHHHHHRHRRLHPHRSGSDGRHNKCKHCNEKCITLDNGEVKSSPNGEAEVENINRSVKKDGLNRRHKQTNNNISTINVNNNNNEINNNNNNNNNSNEKDFNNKNPGRQLMSAPVGDPIKQGSPPPPYKCHNLYPSLQISPNCNCNHCQKRSCRVRINPAGVLLGKCETDSQQRNANAFTNRQEMTPGINVLNSATTNPTMTTSLTTATMTSVTMTTSATSLVATPSAQSEKKTSDRLSKRLADERHKKHEGHNFTHNGRMLTQDHGVEQGLAVSSSISAVVTKMTAPSMTSGGAIAERKTLQTHCKTNSSPQHTASRHKAHCQNNFVLGKPTGVPTSSASLPLSVSPTPLGQTLTTVVAATTTTPTTATNTTTTTMTTTTVQQQQQQKHHHHHHHLRRRNQAVRNKEFNAAMQQVADWVNREHNPQLREQAQTQRAPDAEHLVHVQRHEHHHVHEYHHHHHYHHYYQT